MCDYSLAHFPNRLAVEGEQLVVHRFSSGTLGLVSACPSWKQIVFRASTRAVCVPPGAGLLLRDIPRPLRWRFGVHEIEEVTFVEQSAEAFSYRDAVRFGNGREILLQHLRCGQRVDVLRLTSEDPGQDEAKHRRLEEEYRRVFVG
jgi:hypothetical protein